MSQIRQEHLEFLEECRDIFGENILRETHISKDGDLIALRQGLDRDCIEIYELGQRVGLFAQMIYRTNDEEYVRAVAKSRGVDISVVTDDEN